MVAGVTFGHYNGENQCEMTISLFWAVKDYQALAVFEGHYVGYRLFSLFSTRSKWLYQIQHFQMVSGVTFGRYKGENQCERTACFLDSEWLPSIVVFEGHFFGYRLFGLFSTRSSWLHRNPALPDGRRCHIRCLHRVDSWLNRKLLDFALFKITSKYCL